MEEKTNLTDNKNNSGADASYKENADKDKKYYKCKDCGKAVEYLDDGRCSRCYWDKRDIDWLTAYDNCYGDF